MKVILFNGSRNENGSTRTALNLVADSLKENGIDTEIFWVGGKALTGEIDALVEEAIAKVQDADGIVLGSPVYYASPSGEMVAFLDRLYWKGEKFLRFKPAAAITVARRRYIRFVDGDIILGEVNNNLMLKISNDKISFLQNGIEVAYMTDNKLYITDGEFLNSLQLGNFAFYPRTSGNLSFKKIK